MGTFEVIYPMYDRSATSLLATHAENEYAQMLLEGGVLGLAVVLVFVGMIARKYGRCIRSAPSPMASAAVGLGFALLAVMLQSFTDFGQHVPANATLSAMFCALVVTLARASRQTSPADAPQPVKRRTWRVAGAIGAGVLCLVVLLQSWGRARAESLWAPAKQIEPQLRADRWIGDVRVYRRLLDAAIEGSDRSPHDIHYRYWLNYYRWKYIRQSRDPGTGQLILSEQQIQWSRRIVHELLNGLRDCPTYGPTYSLAGQIALNVLNDPRGPALIRTGWRLSQADPQANMEAGLLDAREGKWDDALKKLRHAADIDTAGGYLDEGVETLARDLHRPDKALELAGDNVQAVRRIVRVLEAGNEPQEAASVKQHLASLIKSVARAPRASKTALQDAGQLALEQRDFVAAVEYFRRALSFDLADAELRLQLARALAEAGQLKQALEEAETAGRLGSESARNFALELKLRPQTRPSSAPTH
jgi:tetratricopeptide (TPR) repeat protein